MKRKEDECRNLRKEIDITWKEKEAEWTKRSQEYEKKLDLIQVALEDYYICLKWTDEGLALSELMGDEEIWSDDEDECL